MSVSIRVVDHPSLGYTRKAIALVMSNVRIAYMHNDFKWHDLTHLCCPKVFTGTHAAEDYITGWGLRS